MLVNLLVLQKIVVGLSPFTNKAKILQMVILFNAMQIQFESIKPNLLGLFLVCNRFHKIEKCFTLPYMITLQHLLLSLMLIVMGRCRSHFGLEFDRSIDIQTNRFCYKVK